MKMKKRICLGLLLAVVACGLLGYGVKLIQNARQAARISVCSAHMFKQRMDIENFYWAKGHYPIGRQLLPDGTVVPWVEDLYGLFGNYSHADVGGYRCPVFSDLKVTNFIGVIGEDTVWRVQQPVKVLDITDPLESTILVLEVDNSHLQPGDLTDWTYVNLKQHLGPTGVLEPILIGRHYRNILFADGQIFTQRQPIDLQTLQALLTTSGGETITRDQLVAQGVLEYRSGKKW